MAKIAQSLTELVGNTPILELKNYEEAKHLPAHLLAKLEYFNPLGSVKDRVAEAMIEQGIKDGLINDKTDQWQYRNRAGICMCGKEAASDFNHAGYHEC